LDFPLFIGIEKKHKRGGDGNEMQENGIEPEMKKAQVEAVRS
jgi:hypothetical protein